MVLSGHVRSPEAAGDFNGSLLRRYGQNPTGCEYCQSSTRRRTTKMTSRHCIAVIDIGKTNAKLALVDLAEFREIAVRRTPNRPKPGPPYPHHDHEHLKAFILESLAAFNRDFAIDALSVTAHGATVALLGEHGDLAL